MKKIAVYGSLKKGFYNYFEDMGEPIARGKIKGAMFLCGSYPHLYRPEVSEDEQITEHDVEIYNIADIDYQGIEGMEIGAGYQKVAMEIEGHEVIVFYSRDDYHYKKDWIEAYTQSLFKKVHE